MRTKITSAAIKIRAEMLTAALRVNWLTKSDVRLELID